METYFPLEIDYQNIGGKFSVFTKRFLEDDQKSYIIVFTEPNNFVLASEKLCFGTHRIIKNERVAILYHPEELELVHSVRRRNFYLFSILRRNNMKFV